MGQADEKLVRKVYPVADLVVPIEGAPGHALAQGAVLKSPGLECCAQPVEAPLPETLVKLITSHVSPKSWVTAGGTGTIDFFPLGMGLVVTQSAKNHEQIASMLDSLRKLQDVQVAVEIRLVRVASGFLSGARYSRIGDGELDQIETDFYNRLRQPTPIFLNDKQLQLFLDAAQGDRRTNVMQAPKLTMFNGQKAVIQVGETQQYLTGLSLRETEKLNSFAPHCTTHFLGTRLEVQGVVAADRQSIAMNVKAQLSRLNGPVSLQPVTTPIYGVFDDGTQSKPIQFTQYLQIPNIQKIVAERSAAIPNGSTMLFVAGKITTDVESECCPPVLCEIPYINRLFTKVMHSEQHDTVLVLVTPRIVEVKDEVVQVGPNKAYEPYRREIDYRPAAKIEASDFVIFDYEWAKEMSAELSMFGSKHLAALAARSTITLLQVRIEPTGNSELDNARRLTVIRFLRKQGIDDPEHSVSFGSAMDKVGCGRGALIGGLVGSSVGCLVGNDVDCQHKRLRVVAKATPAPTMPLIADAPSAAETLETLPAPTIWPTPLEPETLSAPRVVGLPLAPRPTEEDLKDFYPFGDPVVDPQPAFDVIEGRSHVILLKRLPTAIQSSDASIIRCKLLDPTHLQVLGRKSR